MLANTTEFVDSIALLTVALDKDIFDIDKRNYGISSFDVELFDAHVKVRRFNYHFLQARSINIRSAIGAHNNPSRLLHAKTTAGLPGEQTRDERIRVRQLVQREARAA
jgi:hypothetical protein